MFTVLILAITLPVVLKYGSKVILHYWKSKN